MMEGVERKENEIFVRNLAYSVKSEDLIALFEECGPVKRASIAQDGEVSKGFGFVKFAFPEDAIAAVEKFQGKELAGRRLILEIAVFSGQSTKTEKDVPVPSKEPKTTTQTTSQVEKNEKSSAANLPGPSLQVVVCGVPSHVNKKSFKEIVQKVHHCKKLVVELVKEDHSLYNLVKDVVAPPGKVMVLTTHSRKDANTLVTKLDKATPKSIGILEQTSQSEQHRKLPNLAARLLKDITGEVTRKRKCRLIIRNLSFQAIEENILQKFQKFGPITEVSIPRLAVTVPVTGKGKQAKNGGQQTVEKLKPRGFGFVTFLCESDAQTAVAGGCDGMKICNREFAVDFCLNRHAHEWELKRSEDEKTGENHEESKAHEGEEDDEREESDVGDEEDEKEEEEEEEEDDDNEEEEEEDESEDQDEAEDDDDMEQSEEASETKPDGAEEDDDDDDEGKAKAPPGPTNEELTDVNEGRTVFIRDLPYDATPADLKKSFARYGKVELALIVKGIDTSLSLINFPPDKATGLARGSGFVKFETREGAICAVESAEIGSRAEMAAKKVPPTVKGRPCRVNLAVDRTEAKKLKESDTAHGKDKRNLYLATEGLLVDSAISLKRHGDEQKSNQDMSDADREKRRRAQTEKKKKLANPLYYVSPTRICIRNLKKSLNNSDVYNLCIKAAAAGIKNGLVSESDNEAYLAAQCVPIRERTKDKLAVPPPLEGKNATGKKVVVSAKIMLDNAKLRGPNSKPQSRGYGFVEFSHHCYALACVRELNNNTLYAGKYAQNGNAGPGKASTLIVDFSLENVQKIQVLNQRKEKRLQKQEGSSASQGDEGNSEEKNDETNEEEKDEESIVAVAERSEQKKKRARPETSGEGSVQQEQNNDRQANLEKKKLKKLEIEKKRKMKEEKRKEIKKQRRE